MGRQPARAGQTAKSTEVYYGDFMLQSQGSIAAVSAEYHLAKMKALLLISDRVYVPLSHMLSIPTGDFRKLFVDTHGRHGKSAMHDFVKNDLIWMKFPLGVESLPDYIESYRERGVLDGRELDERAMVFNDRLELPLSVTHYDVGAQTAMFREVLERSVRQGRYAFGSDKVAASLLSPDLVYREDFDRKARELRACMGDATYGRLKHDFDVSYFAIGSLSNGSIVAGNSFFDFESSSELNRFIESDGIAMGPLYDPVVFIMFLIGEGVIGSPLDLNLLSASDIALIKSSSCYPSFIRAYGRMHGAAASLATLACAKEAGRSIRMVFKSMLGLLVVLSVCDVVPVSAIRAIVDSALVLPASDLLMYVRDYLGLMGIEGVLFERSIISSRPLGDLTASFLERAEALCDPLGSFCEQLESVLSAREVSSGRSPWAD